MKSGGILIVEDEGKMTDSLAISLRHKGFKIIGPFSELDDAIAQSRQTKPDLILVDITSRFSYEWLKIASTIWEELGMPVAYISPYPEDILRSLLTLPGPSFCLRTPYSEGELLSVVRLAQKKKKKRKPKHES